MRFFFAWMDSYMHTWCLREIVHLHVHAGNQILVLCNNNKCSVPLSQLSSPGCFDFMIYFIYVYCMLKKM